MIIIGISGKKQTGKDTAAAIIKDLINMPTEIIGFADPLKWEVAHACRVSPSYIEKHKKVFRTILQWWGTDFRRKLHSEDYWIKQIQDQLSAMISDVAILKDVRFTNEADFIKNNGGFLIRICRTTEQDNHISETDLDCYDFDYIIDNNGSLESLKHQLIAILKQIQHKVKQHV